MRDAVCDASRVSVHRMRACVACENVRACGHAGVCVCVMCVMCVVMCVCVYCVCVCVFEYHM